MIKMFLDTPESPEEMKDNPAFKALNAIIAHVNKKGKPLDDVHGLELGTSLLATLFISLYHIDAELPIDTLEEVTHQMGRTIEIKRGDMTRH